MAQRGAVARTQEVPGELAAYDVEELLTYYREMLLIRRFEEKAAEAYALGKIGGFCHLYIGQEAVAVGAIAALREDDYLISAYREHGQALARGMAARSVMAELFGKQTGCSKGKGGSMHLFDMGLGFLGGHAIVGSHIPIAAGQWDNFSTLCELVRERGVDFLNIHVLSVGGFTMGMKAAGMAQAFNLPVGNGDHFDLHLHAAVPNGWRAEFHVNNWLTWKVLYKEVPEPVDGWVTLSERPGLGLDLNPDAVKEYREN